MRLLPTKLLDFLTAAWRRVPIRGPGRLVRVLLELSSRAGPIEARLPTGGRVLIAPENPPEVAVYLWGTYEPDVIEVIQETVEAGATAIDVGANCGVLTVAMRDVVGATGTVVSVDPSPAACRRVASQASTNGYENVVVVCAALADRAGRDNYFSAASGIGVLPEVDQAFATASPVAVALRTMDEMVDDLELDAVALVKIDTDGAELGVLQGGIRTLTRDRPTLVVEICPAGLARRGQGPEDVIQMLSDFGYVVLIPLAPRPRRWVARPGRIRGFTSFGPQAARDLGRSSQNVLALDPILHGTTVSRLQRPRGRR